MRFEWDKAKAAVNLKIHAVSFDEAVEAFFDPNAVEGFDAEHSGDEDRFYIIGFSSR
ncbi:MAG: BrnT family toxin [Pyrinomonadaceae bacterium]